jgi:hypothetical protein
VSHNFYPQTQRREDRISGLGRNHQRPWSDC